MLSSFLGRLLFGSDATAVLADSSVTRLASAGHQCWAWITPSLVLIAHCAVTARAQTPILPQGPRNALIYSTYLGGSSNDAVHAVAVDSQGNVYLAGETASADFPVTLSAFQTKHGGRPGNDCSIFTGCYLPDAFVTKLDPFGKIVYSTYLGGSSSDVAVGIAVDAQGDAYVAGTTSSSNFPVTAGAFQTTPLNNSTHAFILKLNPSGSSLIFLHPRWRVRHRKRRWNSHRCSGKCLSGRSY